MQHHRYTRARRAKRLVRLVRGTAGARRRRSPIGAAEALAYENGLFVVRQLQDLFPEFYAKHVAQRPFTQHALLAVVCAFLSLVNRDLFEIEDCLTLDVPMDPLKALKYDEAGYEDPLGALEESSYWLRRPRPVFYGVGMQVVLEDETPQSMLTLALWHLCRETNWSTGVDVRAVIEFSHVPPNTQEIIERLTPLPAGTHMELVSEAIALPGRPWSGRLDELLRYPFSRCDNAMLNVTNYEIDVFYGGETDDDWGAARAIAENARDAALIVELYRQWSKSIEANPERELKKLTKALHTAAAQPRPKTLIDLLVPELEEVAL